MEFNLFLFQENGGGGSLIWTLLPFVFIFGIFYFLVILPQKRQKQQLQEMIEKGWPLEHSHSLEDQIGGQCDAGLVITAFYEDVFAADSGDIPSRFMPCFYATRAVRM